MYVEGGKIALQIADKQFEILGEKMNFSDIPDDGVITFTEGKKEKRDYWYNIYKLTEKQQEDWEMWAKEILRKVCKDEKEVDEVFLQLDLKYGFIRRYIKKGELF